MPGTFIWQTKQTRKNGQLKIDARHHVDWLHLVPGTVAFGARHHGKRFSRTDSINHTNAKSRVKRSNASRLMRASRQNHATDECGRSGQAMFANSRRLPTNSVYRQTLFTDRLRLQTDTVCMQTPLAGSHHLQADTFSGQDFFRKGDRLRPLRKARAQRRAYMRGE